jgi:hypothetical protein
MKKLILIILLLMPVLPANSQVKEGDNLLGFSIGLWTKGNMPVLGVSFESHIAGYESGTLGIGGLFRYHGYSENYNNGDSRNYNFSSFGFQTNFNFNNIGDGKFVPYLGLTLGYNNVINSYTNINRNGVIIQQDNSYNSGVWIWGQLGARYFFSSKVAGTLRVGIGNNDFYPLELGVDFKL